MPSPVPGTKALNPESQQPRCRIWVDLLPSDQLIVFRFRCETLCDEPFPPKFSTASCLLSSTRVPLFLSEPVMQLLYLCFLCHPPYESTGCGCWKILVLCCHCQLCGGGKTMRRLPRKPNRGHFSFAPSVFWTLSCSVLGGTAQTGRNRAL